MITKEQFFADVLHEINMLKEHATKEELANLDFETLAPSMADKCIYGQMTGNCSSKRAKNLMDKACVRVTNRPLYMHFSDLSHDNMLTYINGEYTGQTWEVDSDSFFGRDYKYFSMVEAYILGKDAKNKEIISYLKGEQDTLTL